MKKKSVQGGGFRKVKGLNDLLATLLFFAASFISLNAFIRSGISYSLGVVFLICGIYGFICYSKRARFIF